VPFLRYIVDFIIHIDVHLGEIFGNYGLWVYGILFLIVFCKTGLVVTPLLPGDSLLFAAGTFAAIGSFDSYKVIGGISWVVMCVLAGFYFDNLSLVKNNFSAVLGSIIITSILPGLVEFLRHKYGKYTY
jgi:membrane protein DedA with SNARE-associated domain